MSVDEVLTIVRAEVERARLSHAPMHSPHEGYAVIAEEVDELWDEVKRRDGGRAFAEAIQVAAMAVRYVCDLNPTLSELLDRNQARRP